MEATKKHIEETVQRLDRELLFGLRDKEKAMLNAIHEYRNARYRVIEDAINLKGLVNENYELITKEYASKITTLRNEAKRMKSEDKNSGIEKLLNYELEFDNLNFFDWLYDNLGKDQYRTFMVKLRDAIDDGGPGKGASIT